MGLLGFCQNFCLQVKSLSSNHYELKRCGNIPHTVLIKNKTTVLSKYGSKMFDKVPSNSDKQYNLLSFVMNITP